MVAIQQEFESRKPNAMIKNRGTRPQTIHHHLVTCGHAHVTFSFLIIQELNHLFQFRTIIINFFMRHRHQTGTIFTYQPPISDRHN